MYFIETHIVVLSHPLDIYICVSRTVGLHTLQWIFDAVLTLHMKMKKVKTYNCFGYTILVHSELIFLKPLGWWSLLLKALFIVIKYCCYTLLWLYIFVGRKTLCQFKSRFQ